MTDYTSKAFCSSCKKWLPSSDYVHSCYDAYAVATGELEKLRAKNAALIEAAKLAEIQLRGGEHGGDYESWVKLRAAIELAEKGEGK